MQSNYSNNCIHRYDVEICNIFDLELQLINIKPMIKIKLKELSSELKKFKCQTILVLDYKKKKYCKIFYLCTKLIASNSDIDEAFKSMLQSIMAGTKRYACKDWIALDVIIQICTVLLRMHSIKIFEY